MVREHLRVLRIPMGATSGGISCERFSERQGSLPRNGGVCDTSTPSALPAMPESFFARRACLGSLEAETRLVPVSA